MTRAVRTVIVVIGGIAVVVGAVWIGQGMNLIPGSFMTGDRTWAMIGLLAVLVGVVLVVVALRRRARP